MPGDGSQEQRKTLRHRAVVLPRPKQHLLLSGCQLVEGVLLEALLELRQVLVGLGVVLLEQVALVLLVILVLHQLPLVDLLDVSARVVHGKDELFELNDDLGKLAIYISNDVLLVFLRIILPTLVLLHAAEARIVLVEWP